MQMPNKRHPDEIQKLKTNLVKQKTF